MARFLRHSVQALGVTTPSPRRRLEDELWAADAAPAVEVPDEGGPEWPSSAALVEADAELAWGVVPVLGWFVAEGVSLPVSSSMAPDTAPRSLFPERGDGGRRGARRQGELRSRVSVQSRGRFRRPRCDSEGVRMIRGRVAWLPCDMLGRDLAGLGRALVREWRAALARLARGVATEDGGREEEENSDSGDGGYGNGDGGGRGRRGEERSGIAGG